MCAGYRPGLYWQVMWRFLSPALMAVIILSSSYFMFTNHPTYSAWDSTKVTTTRTVHTLSHIQHLGQHKGNTPRTVLYTPHPTYSAWHSTKESTARTVHTLSHIQRLGQNKGNTRTPYAVLGSRSRSEPVILGRSGWLLKRTSSSSSLNFFRIG